MPPLRITLIRAIGIYAVPTPRSTRACRIVLFTDNADTAAQNAEALPQIIDKLLGDGYSFVTVSDLIKSDSGLSELLPSPLKVKMPKGASLAQYTEPKTSTDGSTDASEDTSSSL